MSFSIVIFLEGSPGHEKQSRAVVSEICRLRPEVIVEEVQLPRQNRLQRIEGRCCLSFCSARCLKNITIAGRPDLFVGTGSATHVMLLAAKQNYKVPAITCMAPDRGIRGQFDLCLVPRHDRLPASENIFITDGPPVLSAVAGPKDPEKGLILLGGCGLFSGLSWKTRKIVDFVATVAQKDPAKQWIVSSSPRTPQDTCDHLARFAQETGLVSFFHYADTPKGWIEERYRESAMVWVTVDSISMMYEALGAGCRVGVYPLPWRVKGSKYQFVLENFSKRKWVVDFYSWLEGQPVPAPVQLNEARRCAEEIIRRWL